MRTALDERPSIAKHSLILTRRSYGTAHGRIPVVLSEYASLRMRVINLRPRLSSTDIVVMPVVLVGGALRLGYPSQIPLAVLLQLVQDRLRVGVDQVGPGLEQRVHDVVDETDLK